MNDGGMRKIDVGNGATSEVGWFLYLQENHSPYMFYQHCCSPLYSTRSIRLCVPYGNGGPPSGFLTLQLPLAVVRYAPSQDKKIEDSIQIRKVVVPVELLKLVLENSHSADRSVIIVAIISDRIYFIGLMLFYWLNYSYGHKIKEANREFPIEELVVELPLPLKRKIMEEILDRLQSMKTKANISEQRGILVRALEFTWDALSGDMGLWMPTEIIHKEHNDKRENAEEPDENILPGRPVPPECHAELHTDYGGAAVRWGLTHPKESASDCCQACLDQAKRAKPGAMKCNIWVYCPAEEGCYSPDIYQHKNQECWLKYAKEPRVTFKDRYFQDYRMSHPKAPEIVPWFSGVVSA